MTDIRQALRGFGVIPVIAIEDAADALPLADALMGGGLPVAEITFRTAAAPEAIARIAAERPEVRVGAGTVLTVEHLRAAHAAGAQFALAPGFNPEVVCAAQDLGILFVPGIATPSEIEQAMALGCTLLKLFPAGVLGGVPYVEALAGPYAHTGLGLVPTGGVTPGNLAAYLAAPMVAAVGGTWIAKRDAIAGRAWDSIAHLAAEAVEGVAAARG